MGPCLNAAHQCTIASVRSASVSRGRSSAKSFSRFLALSLSRSLIVAAPGDQQKRALASGSGRLPSEKQIASDGEHEKGEAKKRGGEILR